ncbi:MAG TPA: HsdR family type I site-specific deoxyribonuclease [Thermoanaerobaculia bacterium]|nr:HsdR family type I site-specific deoxyribonuclease [Thermoanaerobaculia bacterium]
MANFLTEADVERSLLEQFQELGYETASGPEIAPGGERSERKTWSDVVLRDRLRSALVRINAHLPAGAVEEALRKVGRLESPSLIQSNRRFHQSLVEKVDVEVQLPARAGGGISYEKVALIDFEDPESNDFLAVSQFRLEENRKKRRLDVVVFVNGLPLALFEIKNPADENATIRDAFKQLQTYKGEFPTLFSFNEILVATDGLEARAGTLTADWDRFMPWRTVDGSDVAPQSLPQLDVLVAGMFDKGRLLDLVRSFVVFEDDGRSVVKKMAAYHQFHAVNKAVECTLRAASPQGDRRIGVVWHTQGSGKSLSMVFYAGKIAQEPAMANPTLVVLTDRNDLDDQLFGTFAACGALLRQAPKQAENRDEMRELLKVASGGVVFTTIQKFLPDEKGERHPLLSDRSNVVVIADEAHRSQYGFTEGFARRVRDALPNASFIGFTGTPIEIGDRSTPLVFGDYIDVYDIQRSIDDGATVRIYYEARMARLALKEDERPRIDPDFEEVTEAEEEAHRERLKSKWSQIEKLVGAPRRVALVATDLVRHFETRDAILEGKAMIVAMSRRICVDLYQALVALRPDWHDADDTRGAIKVVMTGTASDDATWQPHIRSKSGRDRIAKRFKDAADPLKIVIVRDMWLTGFDVPSLHTMYVDKPMHGHTLMQAIARVNRVFKNKPGGLVVDYLGLAEELRQAVASYTEGGGRGKAKVDIEEILPVLREKYEILRDMLHGFDVEAVLTGPASKRSAGVAAAMDYVLGVLPDGRKRFLDHVADLSRLFALGGAHPEAAPLLDEVAFFQAVRAGILKRTPGEGRRSPEDLDAAIRQIVSRAVVSDEVVDVFAAVGLNKPEISILSDEFLEEVRNLPYRNLAAELLQRLLNEEVKRQEKKNIIQARSFAAMLEEAIRRYQNRSIETAQLIVELIDMAKDFRQRGRRGEELGLTEEELAFYDALETNDSAVAVLGDETLRTIARELTRTVRANATIDWSLRESARARLRLTIKKLLNKYRYPPDKQEKATQTVLAQAEQLGEFFVETDPTDLPETETGTGTIRPFRVVPHGEVKPFENAVPVYDLKIAAGRFSGEQHTDSGFQGEETAHPERFEWAELPDYYRPRPGMFVAQVSGESMNRRIASGSWGLFRLSPQGSREGKTVLVQHREIQDTDLGGHFTLKRYHSEKAQNPDGTWQHTRIVLSPDTTAEGYEPIVIEASGDEEVRMIAEWLGVVG